VCLVGIFFSNRFIKEVRRVEGATFIYLHLQSIKTSYLSVPYRPSIPTYKL
jgi:hypothetical protein